MIVTLANTSSCRCRDGRSQVELSFVHGSADDTPCQAQVGQSADVIELADPSGGNERQADFSGWRVLRGEAGGEGQNGLPVVAVCSGCAVEVKFGG